MSKTIQLKVKDEFVYPKSLQEYSTEEKIIGTWTNKKPLYRKSIFGVLPSSNSWEIQALGIENLEYIVRHDFYFDNSAKQRYKAPYYESSSYYVLYSLGDIESGENYNKLYIFQKGFSANAYRIDLEYTKSTD